LPHYEDYHRTVVGYHGTTLATAKRIVARDTTFTPSQNTYDWLGHGIYFWEYGPQQAYNWARHQYSANTRVAVVASMIRLGNCFDLLDPTNADTLVRTKRLLERTLTESGETLPRNYNVRKHLDCAVFELFYEMQNEAGEPIDTARAVYVPTSTRKRLWSKSWLYRETHIQLCVRDPRCILGTWLMEPVEE